MSGKRVEATVEARATQPAVCPTEGRLTPSKALAPGPRKRRQKPSVRRPRRTDPPTEPLAPFRGAYERIAEYISTTESGPTTFLTTRYAKPD